MISLNTFYSDMKVEFSCYFGLLSELNYMHSPQVLRDVRGMCACGIPVVGRIVPPGETQEAGI